MKRQRYIDVGGEKNITDPNNRTFDEREKELEKIENIQKMQAKKLRNSPYARFAQYNLNGTADMIWLIGKSPKAAQLFLFIVDQMDKTNAIVCSHNIFASSLDMSVSTIRRNLKLLEQHGYIAIMKTGGANVYHVNSKLYWKNHGNKVWQSKLNANVLLSLDEQGELYRKRLNENKEIIRFMGKECIHDTSTGEVVKITK